MIKVEMDQSALQQVQQRLAAMPPRLIAAVYRELKPLLYQAFSIALIKYFAGNAPKRGPAGDVLSFRTGELFKSRVTASRCKSARAPTHRTHTSRNTAATRDAPDRSKRKMDAGPTFVRDRICVQRSKTCRICCRVCWSRRSSRRRLIRFNKAIHRGDAEARKNLLFLINPALIRAMARSFRVSASPR